MRSNTKADNRIFELVFLGRTEYLTYEEVCKKYTITNHSHTNPSQRQELHGSPKIKGFYGAMYGGRDERGNVILRYETPKVYDILSC